MPIYLVLASIAAILSLATKAGRDFLQWMVFLTALAGLFVAGLAMIAGDDFFTNDIARIIVEQLPFSIGAISFLVCLYAAFKISAGFFEFAKRPEISKNKKDASRNFVSNKEKKRNPLEGGENVDFKIAEIFGKKEFTASEENKTAELELPKFVLKVAPSIGGERPDFDEISNKSNEFIKKHKLHYAVLAAALVLGLGILWFIAAAVIQFLF